MPPGPVQHAAVVALGDDVHVEAQRARYLDRLERLAALLDAAGYPAPLPSGAFYLWVKAPGDAWDAAADLAARAGIVVSPGEFYGPAGSDHFRVAAVQPDDRIALAASRVGA
jgi:aspartate/methionine/tyrosine aminotransferase